VRNKLIALAVLALGGLAVYALLIRGGDSDESGYKTVEVGRGDITSYVSATGTVSPKVSVLVGTEVSGTIMDIYVEENDRVAKGAVMLKLDPELFEARLTQAKATLGAAQAAHAELVAERASIVAEVESGIERAEAEYAESDVRLTRGQELFDKGMISREELDALMREQAVKKSAYNQALAGRARLKAYDSRIDAAASRVGEARAAMDTAMTNLEKTVIASPMDGVVITRNVDVGQTVAASFNTPELFEVGDLGVMEVEVSVDEADVGRVSVGMEAEFTVDAYPGEVFRGRVSRLSYSPVTVQNVVTYTGVIEVANDELKLRPGMTANVEVITSRKENVLVVPSSALRVKLDLPEKDGAGKPGGSRHPMKDATVSDTGTVYVMVDGSPEARTVRLGDTDYRNTEILSGLSEGETVIVENSTFAGRDDSSRRTMRMFH